MFAWEGGEYPGQDETAPMGHQAHNHNIDAIAAQRGQNCGQNVQKARNIGIHLATKSGARRPGNLAKADSTEYPDKMLPG